MQGDELSIFGAWIDHIRHTKDPRAFQMSWPEFVNHLASQLYVRSEKDALDGTAPLFSLSRFIEKEGKTLRQKAYVDLISAIVLDYDKGFDQGELFSALEATGLTWFAYTTFTHTPDDPRWRVIVPTSTPIPAGKYKALRAWFLSSLLHRGSGVRIENDDSDKAISRPFYLPGCPPGNEDFAEFKYNDGPVLDLPPMTEIEAQKTPTPRIIGSKLDVSWLHARMHAYPKDKEIRRAFKKVIAGKPYADFGGRDTMLQRMLGVVVGWAPQAEPEDIVNTVFAASIQATIDRDAETGDPAPDLDNAIDKAARIQAALAEQVQEDSEFIVDDAQVVDMPEEVADENQVAAMAEGVSLTEAEFMQRLILRRGDDDALWIWSTDNNDWRGPMRFMSAALIAKQELSKIPGVEMWTRNRDNKGVRFKTVQELEFEHGEVLRQVVIDLRADRGSYDPKEKRLVRVGAPRRELQPERDETVAQWLGLLGGQQHDKLLDWIAALTWLDKANSVLFINGKPGVGKGLLCRGLARVWMADNPIKLKRIAKGDFNDDLMKCPLVVIDEGKWFQNVDVTTILRELTTEPSRMMNPKHHAATELLGFCRFVVTANNMNIFANDQYALTPDDRDAIAKRFLEVTPTEAAAMRFLTAMTPDEQDSLAADDRIARHALWLAENRAIKPGQRLVVEGEANVRFATRIITQDKSWGSWVATWLVRYLTNPILVERTQGGLVLRDGGRVFVAADAVINTFDQLVKNKKPPQDLEIVNALKSLSTDGKPQRIADMRATAFEILLDEILHFAEESSLGNVETMRENANATRPIKAPTIVRLPTQGGQQ